MGAYFSSTPNQDSIGSLKIIKGSDPNPLPLISTGHVLSDYILFGLFKDDNNNLDLLVINMRNTIRNLRLDIEHKYQLFPTERYIYRCDSITRMYHVEDPQPDVHSHYTKITLNDMHGGECAILHLTKIAIP